MSNVRHLGDEVEAVIFWPPHAEYQWIPCVITGFHDNRVEVTAINHSDDPDVDNEWSLPFRNLR